MALRRNLVQGLRWFVWWIAIKFNYVCLGLVTPADGREVYRFAPQSFHAVLADVPWSAEGNVRKYASNLEAWNEHPTGRRESMAALQMELLDSAWSALRPGGVLIYSTCTLNSIENEEICEYLLQKNAVPLQTSELAGLGELGLHGHALRVWPHMFDTEGFFLAAFQKEQAHAAEMVRPPSPRASVRCKELLSPWPRLLQQCGDRFIEKDEGIYSMPDCQRLPKLMQLAEEEGVLLLRRDGDEFYLTDEAILLGGREMGPQDDAAWWLNLSSGLEGNLGGFNAQIDARAELGDVRGAEEVMSHILKRGLRPDVVTYTTLIKAYGRESSMSSAQKAVKILEDAREDGIWLDSAAFSTALYALARAGSLQQCERLLRSMGSSRVSPDSACFNSVIHACAAAGEPERAKYWLDQAEASSSHSPTDIACYAAVLNAQARAACSDEAEAVMTRVKDPNLICFNSLLNAFARASKHRKAELCLQQIRAAELLPDAISFNTAISAQGWGGDMRTARKLFEDMLRSRVQASARTFVAMGSCSERGGDWTSTLSLFNEMLTLGIPPEQRAYAMLLSAYGNAKQQQDASQLFLKMPRRYQEDGLVREAIWRCFGKDAVQVFREAEASRPGAARPGKASKANR